MLRDFVVAGYNLDQIPLDAIGILAISNSAPLQFLDTMVSAYIIPIADLQQNSLSLRQAEVHNVGAPSYLGCIVSPDRSVVYWVNNNGPLP